MVTRDEAAARVTQHFFESPILNSPYAAPDRHWELDEGGQSTDHILPLRRKSALISPIPQPKKTRGSRQAELYAASDAGGAQQEYNPTEVINGILCFRFENDAKAGRFRERWLS